MESVIPPEELADELARHLEFLRRMARALVRDEQVAEDVVQETLVAALVRRPEPEVGLRLWLGSVLKRRVLLHFRTEQRRVARQELLQREVQHSGAVGVANEAERALLSIERSAAVGREVAALDDPYRTVILLRFYEGLQPKDIASRLQRPVATVNTQLQRGLQQLRTKLDTAYGGRREWVSALLPLALDGPDGWWPAGVKGVAGLSYGALTVAFSALLLLVLGLSLASERSGRADAERRDVATGAEAPSSGVDASPAEGELDAPSASPARTALGAPPAPSSSSAAPGTLRLRVGSRFGPVPGARVVARSHANGESKAYSVSSELRSNDGINLRVTLGGLVLETDGPADARRATGVADRDGIVELPLLDGAAWTVQIDAEGFAQRSLSICVTAPSAEQEVELEVASKLIVDRGAFPLDHNIYATIRSPFDSRSHDTLLPRGKQSVEIDGLEPGVFTVEGITTGGVDLAVWSTETVVDSGTVARVDLSLGGNSSLEVEVLGATPAAPAHFAVVRGPLDSRGAPTWARYTFVRNGFARFVALPSGPAVVTILSRMTEIARGVVELRSGAEAQRLTLHIPRGEVRILHADSESASRRFELARRAQGPGSIGGWIEMGRPLARPGEAYYAGLEDGTYCLWAIEDGAAQRFEFQMRGEPVEFDLRARARGLTNVRIERAPGLDPAGSIELELIPKQWASVTPVDGVLALSPGAHRARTPSVGLGYITRSLEVPRDERILFDGPSAATPIEVRCDPVWMGTTVIVTPESIPAPPQRSRNLSLYFDRDGRGRINLCPGVYVLTDRTGRQTSMTVDAQTQSVFVRMP
jgi:RNA polymerase sigma-70 factor (ECF subfamily)